MKFNFVGAKTKKKADYMTTIATTKQVTDYLWEWADQKGDWAKLLVSEIVANACKPNSETLEKIFNYFLKDSGFASTLPPLVVTKALYKGTSKKIVLKKLQQVKGVNRLASDQVLEFGSNLTVVYGRNGSGKTGYARILRSLGQGFSAQPLIYSDVYKTELPKSCSIDYDVDGTAHTSPWTDKTKIPDLTSVAVFTNHCVAASLNPQRGLMVTPTGFHLFQLVTDTLNELHTQLKTLAEKYEVKIEWVEQLHPGTPQHDYVSILHAKSSLEKLQEVATFTADNEKQLPTLQQSLRDLSVPLLEKEIADITLQLQELQLILQSITSCSTIWSGENAATLQSLIEKRTSLETRSVAGHAEIAWGRGVEQYESPEFTHFLQAAEHYIQILGRETYPSEKDACVYCRQPLDESAKALLSAYRGVLNDTTQKELTEVNNKMTSLVKTLSAAVPDFVLHQPSFGSSDEGIVAQPADLAALKEQLTRFREWCQSTADNTIAAAPAYETAATAIVAKRKELQERIQAKQDALTGITKTGAELISKINELLDRRFCAAKIEEIKKVIDSNQVIGKLNTAATQLNTTPISRKTTEAREQLVERKFDALFKNELHALRKDGIKVNVDFVTSKGTSQLKQLIATRNVADILSEGEQKAIAMAEFLTEIQLERSDGPVIFDDPVNSLDHHIIEDVAERLLQVSAQRQVVIFTHNIILLNSIMGKCETTFKNGDNVFYDTETRGTETGMLFRMGSPKKETFEKYVKDIDKLLKGWKKEPASEIAVKGYDLLRSAIEALVENDIFGYVIRRYKPNITMTGLMKVDGAAYEKHKQEINEIFERTCRFITAHTNPEESNYPPTLEEFTADFDKMKEIKKSFPAK